MVKGFNDNDQTHDTMHGCGLRILQKCELLAYNGRAAKNVHFRHRCSCACDNIDAGHTCSPIIVTCLTIHHSHGKKGQSVTSKLCLKFGCKTTRDVISYEGGVMSVCVSERWQLSSIVITGEEQQNS